MRVSLLVLWLLWGQQAFSQASDWIWAQTLHGAGADVAYNLATDRWGNVYIAGTFTSSVMMFDTTIILGFGNPNIFIAKYDSAGTLLWARSAEGVQVMAEGRWVSEKVLVGR